MMEMKLNDWVLVHANGETVMTQDVVLDFRGETATIVGGRPPHKPGSGGVVWTSDFRELYPSVFNLKWVAEKTENLNQGESK